MAETNDDVDPGGRGVLFPAMSLEDAVKRAGELMAAEKRNFARVPRIYEVWKYSPKSSGARQALAGLRAYGLLEFRGRSEHREARISDRAHRILLNAPDAGDHLKAAALDAPGHQEMWEHYKENWPPSDDNVRDHILWKLKLPISAESASRAAKQFKATIEFAKLKSSAKMSETAKDKVGVGSWIHWVSQGQQQWNEPRQVARIDDHDGEKYVFVHGADGAIPMTQAVLADPPYQPPTLLRDRDGMEELRWKLPSGTITLTAPRKMKKRDFEVARKYLDAWELGAEEDEPAAD